MAITLVGTSFSSGSDDGAGPKSITLPAGMQQNDVVFVYSGWFYLGGGGADSNVGVTSLGWTNQGKEGDMEGGTWGASVDMKRMGVSPDVTAAFAIFHDTPNVTGWAAIAAAYRGVDTTTANDAATVKSTAESGSQPDPGSITTVTANALVIVFASEPVAVTPTAPTGYTDLYTTNETGSFSQYTLALASKLKAAAGAENPGPWADFSGGGATEFLSFTAALRPVAEPAGPSPPRRGLSLLGVG